MLLVFVFWIFFFFFNDTATTEIYTLSLHDALPICVYLFTVSLLWFCDPKVNSQLQATEKPLNRAAFRGWIFCSFRQVRGRCADVRTFGPAQRELVRAIYHFFRSSDMPSSDQLVPPNN